jgi:hypothetical protein
MPADNPRMHRKTGGWFFRLLASRSPVPGEAESESSVDQGKQCSRIGFTAARTPRRTANPLILLPTEVSKRAFFSPHRPPKSAKLSVLKSGRQIESARTQSGQVQRTIYPSVKKSDRSQFVIRLKFDLFYEGTV